MPAETSRITNLHRCPHCEHVTDLVKIARDAAFERFATRAGSETTSDVDEAMVRADRIVLGACPKCQKRHADEGAWATRPHRTHRCVDDIFGKGCGEEWRETAVEAPKADAYSGCATCGAKPTDHFRCDRCPPTRAAPPTPISPTVREQVARVIDPHVEYISHRLDVADAVLAHLAARVESEEAVEAAYLCLEHGPVSRGSMRAAVFALARVAFGEVAADHCQATVSPASAAAIDEITAAAKLRLLEADYHEAMGAVQTQRIRAEKAEALLEDTRRDLQGEMGARKNAEADLRVAMDEASGLAQCNERQVAHVQEMRKERDEARAEVPEIEWPRDGLGLPLVRVEWAQVAEREIDALRREVAALKGGAKS